VGGRVSGRAALPRCKAWGWLLCERTHSASRQRNACWLQLQQPQCGSQAISCQSACAA
jgi:hypothetical protein